MNRFERDGKHAVNVGDIVHVAARPDGVEKVGWNGGKVLSFMRQHDGRVLAQVTKPGQAGVRIVDAERLTKKAVSA